MKEERLNPFSRREWLRAAAALVAMNTLARGLYAGPEPVKWKTAVGLNGFASSSGKYGKKYPIWEVADFISRTGFDGVELCGDWPSGGYPASGETDRVNALRRLWDDYALQIFSIQITIPGSFDVDPVVRKKWIEQFTDHVKLAKLLGCEWVGVWPVGSLGSQDVQGAIANAVESYREAAHVAEGEGLKISFEIEPPFAFNKEEHLSSIVKNTAHPHFKAMYDPSHFDLMNGSTGKPHEMLKRIGVENIGYVHFTDCDGTLRDGGTSKHVGAGDGHVDVPASLRILKEDAFQGWMMVDAWEIPDPYDACEKAMKAFNKAWE